jgi:hypothetical protein
MTTNGTRDVCAIVDAHVHLHGCYDPDAFFNHAYFNLASAAARTAPPVMRACYLLMTECESDDYFGRLHDIAAGRGNGQNAGKSEWLKRWKLRSTGEQESLVAEEQNRRLYVVAGRQIACREGLEVLILGTRQKFQDGARIREVLEKAASLGLPHVIPWGLGKWFFARGKLLSSLMREYSKPTLFLGDEGGRPGFWPYPSHFREGAGLGVRDLPGTDPLPFPHDVSKVGRVGIRVPISLDEQQPARSLLNVLCDGRTPLDRFASLEPPIMFVRNQVAMQLRKRRPPASSAANA